MGRGPSHIGRAPAHLTVLPGGAASSVGGGLDDLEEDRTTIEPEPPSASDEAPTPIAASAASMDEQWEDGTTVAESGEKRTVVDEPTVEDQARPLPPLQLVQGQQGTATGAQDPRALAKLHVVSGSDQGRTFDLRPGKELSVGRAVDNDVVLTDIAVSRRHLELAWDGDAWVLRDRGSGNGTLINDRIEDGKCQLRDGDRIEIGNTLFRFDHPPSASNPTVTGWGQDEEEAATVAGKQPGRSPSSTPVPTVEPQRPRHNSVTAAAERRSPPPPGTPQRAKRPSQTPEPPKERPMTVRGMPAMQPPAPPEPVPPPQFLANGSSNGPAAAPVGTPPIASMFGPGVRPATTTALVEPRIYPPAAAYPFVIAPDNRKKHLMIGAGVAGLLLIIGLGAMLGGDDTPPPQGVSAKVVGGETGSATASAKPPAPSAGEIPPPASGGGGVASGSAAEPAVGSAAVEPPVPQPPPPTPQPPPPTPPPPPPVVDDEPEIETETPPAPPPPTTTTPAVQKQPPPKPPPPKQPPPKQPPVVRTQPKRTPPPPRVVVKNNDDLLAEKPVVKPGAKGAAAAEKKADGLYKSKDWKAASALLREAAASGASDADAKRLKGIATDYDTIGVNLSTGATLAKANPTQALGALQKALKADRRVGGAHQQAIRENIAKVAPSAAAAYMAKQNYPMAKLAADEAVNVGAGSNATVANVRSSLERKAGELFATAQKLLASSPEEAKTHLRSIMKIVPTDSPWYGKAYKLLNQRKNVSVDEDE